MNERHKIFSIVILMLIGAFARMVPHLPNFTPTESISIFGAAYLGRKYWAFIIPLIVIYFTDFVLNNTIARSFFTEHDGIVWYDSYMIYSALAILCIVWMSTLLLKKIKVGNILASVITGSIVFFLITNFGVWASANSFYPKDLSGLMMSYTAGLPFFKSSLLGNLIFSTILFGSYEIINSFVYPKGTQISDYPK